MFLSIQLTVGRSAASTTTERERERERKRAREDKNRDRARPRREVSIMSVSEGDEKEKEKEKEEARSEKKKDAERAKRKRPKPESFTEDENERGKERDGESRRRRGRRAERREEEFRGTRDIKGFIICGPFDRSSSGTHRRSASAPRALYFSESLQSTALFLNTTCVCPEGEMFEIRRILRALEISNGHLSSSPKEAEIFSSGMRDLPFVI